MGRSFAIASLLAVLLTACPKPLGTFVWVDDYLPPPEPEYEIQPGDVLQVRVYKEDNLSARVRVRSDGMVSLPIINDVTAAGTTPAKLSKQLEAALKSVVNAPVVTVSLEETKPKQFSVIGEVLKPGVYTMEQNLGVVQALANAGGLTEYADRERVFVLRSRPVQARIRFTYEALAHAEGKAAAFVLQPGDVIVVE